MNRKALIDKLNAYERLMRLDKPIGILLLLWPTLWALWIAGEGEPEWIFVAIFTMGTVLMRSAGCVMNDLADRKFDGHVERTQQRPLVTGEVSTKEALVIILLLVLCAFCLILPLYASVIKLSFVAVGLAASYPYTKRFFAIPQAYLGIAFGFGIPMAFAALTHQIPPIAWWMLFANICWSIAYDTAYAMVDRNDDIHIGIRSSALFFGKHDVHAIMLCYALMLSTLTYVGWQIALAWPYFIGLAIATSITIYHYTLIRTRTREGCFKAFMQNQWLGMVIFVGLLLSYHV